MCLSLKKSMALFDRSLDFRICICVSPPTGCSLASKKRRSVRGIAMKLTWHRISALFLPLLLLLTACAAANADGFNFVQNPNFATSGQPTSDPSDTTSSQVNGNSAPYYAYDVDNASPWVFSTGSGVAQTGSLWGWPAPPNGASQNAFLQAFVGTYNGDALDWPASSISQDITGLTANDTYSLEFYLSDRPGNFGATPVEIS